MQITQEILLKNPNLEKLIELALFEDLHGGDLSAMVLNNETITTTNFMAKDDGIIGGLILIPIIIDLAHKNNYIKNKIDFQSLVNEGAKVQKSQIIAKMTGNIKDILCLERTLLNFISRISGIATYTNKMVEVLKGAKPKIFDTRKTLPGWRILDKYAVNVGGGQNHRLDLSDYLMFKDNHLESDKTAVLSYLKMLKQVQHDNDKRRKLVEVEIDNFKYFEIEEIWNADILMLDNMEVDDLKKAINLIRNKQKQHKKYEIEISGGLSIENLESLKNLDVDRISIGKITHSAPSFDISLDFEG